MRFSLPFAGKATPRRFPAFRQLDAMDCGPTCLRMVAKYHGKNFPLEELREKCFINRQGVSLLGISQAAEQIGFRTLSTRATLEQLTRDAPLPCIAHWKQGHFVVVYRVEDDRVYVADPDEGLLTHPVDEFRRHWCSITQGANDFGVLLLLEPTPAFHAREDTPEPERRRFAFLFSYARPYARFFVQVVLGMLVASLLQLVFPFLTQAIVDHGIGSRDLGFVHVVLIAQLALFFSRTAVEFIRNRILFHVGSRIYVSIISDFLVKMMKLPISFFDTRLVGDLLQRIQDHSRIQQFITTTTLNVLFSTFTLVVFSAVLAVYSWVIFGVFVLGSALYVGYVLLFLRRRKELDYQRFTHSARNQSTLVELITGMQEIKLAGAEQQKRWKWERIQAGLFRVNLRTLTLDQTQDGGASFINELKNITITFLAAGLVIEGEMTLGMLLAVQYIIGQLNTPLAQLIFFVKSAQEAKISLERLAEVHDREDEERPGEKVQLIPERRTIALQGVSFGYGGPNEAPVLQDLDLDIPDGKVTAVVGVSGSGKTTLLKLLLKFHEPTRGEIRVGPLGLRSLGSLSWRRACGVVMQDGHLFSDTIASNIAMGEERVDMQRLLHAAEVANIREFVEALPLAYNTRVGSEGVGMSMGQRQRLLIARAVYKDPAYLFFDEATSALDANNERVIMQNLEALFRGRTVVIIAHRLSTVKNADQIVVLERGRVAERGTHAELTERRGRYFELVRNQLEMGN
ncbi:MAG TPA: peptidase domain-containing ABC transporter [Longimicrobium sp.]|nr:peptidase domain-containing ABC transporter [Longimicrobium sp.]